MCERIPVSLVTIPSGTPKCRNAHFFLGSGRLIEYTAPV
jgi:hypothetical protein